MATFEPVPLPNGKFKVLALPDTNRGSIKMVVRAPLEAGGMTAIDVPMHTLSQYGIEFGSLATAASVASHFNSKGIS